jgi:hypothetical protein
MGDDAEASGMERSNNLVLGAARTAFEHYACTAQKPTGQFAKALPG